MEWEGWGGGGEVSLAVERQVDYWGSPCNDPSSVSSEGLSLGI